MPTFDDIPKLEELLPSRDAPLDMVPVWDARTNTIKRFPAELLARVQIPTYNLSNEVVPEGELGIFNGTIILGDGSSVGRALAFLSGPQTLSGAQTFTGPVKLTGLELSDPSSAINVGQADARYVRPQQIITLDDAAARKNPASYAAGELQVGFTKVRQTDMPDVEWSYVMADPTLDASWIPSIGLQPDGSLVADFRFEDYSTPSNVVIPDRTIGWVDGRPHWGDGETIRGNPLNAGLDNVATIDDEIPYGMIKISSVKSTGNIKANVTATGAGSSFVACQLWDGRVIISTNDTLELDEPVPLVGEFSGASPKHIYFWPCVSSSNAAQADPSLSHIVSLGLSNGYGIYSLRHNLDPTKERIIYGSRLDIRVLDLRLFGRIKMLSFFYLTSEEILLPDNGGTAYSSFRVENCPAIKELDLRQASAQTEIGPDGVSIAHCGFSGESINRFMSSLGTGYGSVSIFSNPGSSDPIVDPAIATAKGYNVTNYI